MHGYRTPLLLSHSYTSLVYSYRPRPLSSSEDRSKLVQEVLLLHLKAVGKLQVSFMSILVPLLGQGRPVDSYSSVDHATRVERAGGKETGAVGERGSYRRAKTELELILLLAEDTARSDEEARLALFARLDSTEGVQSRWQLLEPLH